MPVYEYFCPSCKSKFEELRPMSQSTEHAFCPACETPSWRTVSLFAAISRGEGGTATMVAGGGCACGGAGCGCSL